MLGFYSSATEPAAFVKRNKATESTSVAESWLYCVAPAKLLALPTMLWLSGYEVVGLIPDQCSATFRWWQYAKMLMYFPLWCVCQPQHWFGMLNPVSQSLNQTSGAEKCWRIKQVLMSKQHFENEPHSEGHTRALTRIECMYTEVNACRCMEHPQNGHLDSSRHVCVRTYGC